MEAAFSLLLLVLSSSLVSGTYPELARRDKRELIINGKKISITEVPYQVALLIGGFPACGGSIIGRRLILSAGHCLQGQKKAKLKVRAGSSWRDKGGIVEKVARVVVHPKFSNTTGANDIALVLLDEPLKLDGANVSCAKIPEQGEKLPLGSVGKVSGWGRTTPKTGTGSIQLRSTYLTILPFDKCWTAYNEKKLNAKMQYCIGSPRSTGSCQGDSGGPFVVDKTVYGIVSWAESCAKTEYPTIYTDVGAFVQWIRESLVSISAQEELKCDVM
ncbi:trypsin beta-like [Sabethes cyaneus]|uniref:trypsin beta-like n=1 Tax=Sabethes cyaneus TaxID=53552 RepID=UPI00237EE0C3|nr:trypsin beta-like [Sabethes cyaneus]